MEINPPSKMNGRRVITMAIAQQIIHAMYLYRHQVTLHKSFILVLAMLN